MGKIMVAKTSEIPTGKMKKVTADGKEIVVMNIDGNYYAMDDTCTHMGASFGEQGTLDGNIVTCGWHGAKFDGTTGKLHQFPAKINDLATYKVSIESDSVYLEL